MNNLWIVQISVSRADQLRPVDTVIGPFRTELKAQRVANKLVRDAKAHARRARVSGIDCTGRVRQLCNEGFAHLAVSHLLEGSK